MIEEVRNHREKGYAQAARRGQHLQLGFLQHELKISRLHLLLKLACRESNGQVARISWRQGSERSQMVRAPKLRFNREADSYEEVGEQESLQHCRDAFFTLRFGEQEPHFFYGADRRAMSAGAQDPTVTGQRRTGLFWFTISRLFTNPIENGNGPIRPLARSLLEPELILGRFCALPDHSLLSLTDPENRSPLSAKGRGNPSLRYSPKSRPIFAGNKLGLESRS